MEHKIKIHRTLALTFALGLFAWCACSRTDNVSQCAEDDLRTVVQRLSLSEPERVLAILDSAERVQALSPFELDYLRCLIYHNGMSDYRNALKYGHRALDAADDGLDAQDRLKLIDLMADEALNNGDYEESVSLCALGLQLARDSLMPESAQANLHLTFGLNLLEMECPRDAFAHFDKAVSFLEARAEKSEDSEDVDDYIYAVGMTANSLCDEGYYDRALSLMEKYGEGVARLEALPESVDGLADCRRASGCALTAYIYAIKGDDSKAKGQYDLYCATDYSSSPEGVQIRIPYLLASRQFSQALQYIREEKAFWRKSADTLSRAYIDSHLENERKAYEGLGDFEGANRVSHTIQAISDTLRTREREEYALELAEVYRTNEQAAELTRKAYAVKVRDIIIIFSALTLFIAALFIGKILRRNRTIARKNRIMAKTIEDLMDSKGNLAGLRKENIELRDGLATAAVGEDQSGSLSHRAPEPEDATEAASERERVVWERISHDIAAKRLFLDPEVSKKWLIEKYRIPVNKFPAFFKMYAKCSFTQYMQDCRLDYAVSLMREHPQWSLEAIAKESMMSKSTFYQRFQVKYGMTPSEFREQIGS